MRKYDWDAFFAGWERQVFVQCPGGMRKSEFMSRVNDAAKRRGILVTCRRGVFLGVHGVVVTKVSQLPPLVEIKRDLL
jgi:hypothetical protein